MDNVNKHYGSAVGDSQDRKIGNAMLQSDYLGVESAVKPKKKSKMLPDDQIVRY